MPEKSRCHPLRKKLTQFSAYYRNANVAVKASLWFAVCSFIQKGISVLTMPIFTRLMSTEQFGRYNVFLSWYNIFVILVSLNVHSEIFNKGLIEHTEDRDAFTASQAGLLLVLTGFWLAVYLPFREFFNHILSLTTPLVLFMIFEILGSSLVGLWTARKRFEYDYRRIVVLTLSMAVANPICGILAVLATDHQAEARIISNAMIPILFSAGILIYICRRGYLFHNRSWWKPTVLAALPLVPHYLSLVLLNQSDKLMIDHFTGTADAAIYSVAHAAGLLLTIVNTSINHAYVPWSYDRMKFHNSDGLRQVSAALMALVALVNVLLIWIAPEAVCVLAAPQYHEAIWCLAPIAVSVFFFFAYTLFVDAEIYYGANHFIAVASVCAAALNIILNAVFIPAFGYVAAAYTTLTSYFATMLLHLLFLNRVLRRRGQRMSQLVDLRILALLSVAVVVLSGCGMMLYRFSAVRLCVVTAVCVAAAIWNKPLLRLLADLKRRQEE